MGFQDKWLRYDEYVEKNRKLKGKAIQKVGNEY